MELNALGGGNPGTDTGGILIQCGDDNDDEWAIKVENWNNGTGAFSTLTPERRVFGVKATTGTTTWNSGAHVILPHDPYTTTQPGLSAGSIPYQAVTKNYVDSISGSGFDYYESPAVLPISVAPFQNHGLGGIPKFISMSFVCLIADGTWDPGDEMDIMGMNSVHNLWANATQIGYRNDNTPFGYGGWNKDVGTGSMTYNNSRWGFKFRAWR